MVNNNVQAIISTSIVKVVKNIKKKLQQDWIGENVDHFNSESFV